MKISEAFYSVQAEGVSTGIPAYFVRFTGCNLSCGFSGKGLVALKKKVETEGVNVVEDAKFADLHAEGKATWICDSAGVWLKGKEMSPEELASKMETDGALQGIIEGTIRIIWTGGEPTLPIHVKAIEEFTEYMFKTYGEDIELYYELETNGSLEPDNVFLCNFIDQINCSPKLANSGMSKEKRINPEMLEAVNNHQNGWFKFVVSNEEDILEIQDDFIIPFNLDQSKVIIMPGVDSLEELSERTRFTFEMAKKYGYRAITRSQVLCWNKVVGV